MARARMIKPEMWASKRINSVSLEANLLFVALLNFCDDFGTIQNCDRMILGNCFPYRKDITEINIKNWKDELIRVSLVSIIQYESKELLAVVKWEKHQTIQNRSKRNNVDNNKTIPQVINTIDSLISISLDSQHLIEKRKEKSEKEENEKEKDIYGEKSPDSKIEKNGYSPDFENFWKLYTRPNKGDKPKSFQLWKKLTAQEKILAVEKFPEYSKTVGEPKFLKQVERYLKCKVWEGITPEPEIKDKYELEMEKFAGNDFINPFDKSES